MPIIFDAEDHPDRTTAVGCLPMLVSPTICNLKVTKMLVDGGAGLNLISSAVLRRLQVPDSELEETDTFQGINPGRSKPKGKTTLPVTFGSELNFRTDRVTFDAADFPLPYNGILGRRGLSLCIQHAQDARPDKRHLCPWRLEGCPYLCRQDLSGSG